jgi:hypothetical protein
VADLSAEAKAARGAFARWAGARGLNAFEDWGLPEATQLLRGKGFVQTVPNAANGELPSGLGPGWIAHATYSVVAGAGIEERVFTVVLLHVPRSIGFAARVLCHDRGLTELDMSNPDADTEVVELDDRLVELESEGFLARYRLATDHDQDQLRVWQLFSPAMIDWLTAEAPAGFSFELQEGALCCFVPRVIGDGPGLDRLCDAAGRVRARVVELAQGAPSTAPARRTRREMIDAELAARPFAKPPRSVFAAARRFGWWGLVTGHSWRLGLEAFFRAYAATIGFERIEEGAFRASHFGTPVPGEITQVASGRLAGIDHDAYLLFTQLEEIKSGGFSVIVCDREPDSNTFAFATLPPEQKAEARELEITGTNDTNIVWRADTVRRRNADALDDFVEDARRLLIATIAAG